MVEADLLAKPIAWPKLLLLTTFGSHFRDRDVRVVAYKPANKAIPKSSGWISPFRKSYLFWKSVELYALMTGPINDSTALGLIWIGLRMCG